MKDKLKNIAIKDKKWRSKARYRRDNRSWMDVSFDIAVRIGSILQRNKSLGLSPKNQKELAQLMDCSAPYVNKILRGSENLTLETIIKIESALGVGSIIEPSVIQSIEDIFAEVTEIAVPRIDLLSATYSNSSPTSWSTEVTPGQIEYNGMADYEEAGFYPEDCDNYYSLAA